jgi:diketogulonate reductase-like aldo/keto reductase
MVEHLTTLLDRVSVVSAVKQIQCHPYFQQREVQALNAEHCILTQAWSPIGGITFYRDGSHGSTLDDPVIGAIANARGKTPAQVILRWGLQHGRWVIPKSTKPRRIAENIDVFASNCPPRSWPRSTTWTPAIAVAPSPTRSRSKRSAARSQKPETGRLGWQATTASRCGYDGRA